MEIDSIRLDREREEEIDDALWDERVGDDAGAERREEGASGGGRRDRRVLR